MDVRIYIEGGGDQNATRRRLRQAFSQFLSECRDAAREHRCGFKLIVCGGRDQAWDKFFNDPLAGDAVRILLVDSEGPVSSSP